MVPVSDFTVTLSVSEEVARMLNVSSLNADEMFTVLSVSVSGTGYSTVPGGYLITGNQQAHQ